MFPSYYKEQAPQNADASDLDYEKKDLEKTNKKQYNELAQTLQETLGQLITDKENFTIEKLSQKFENINWEDKQETQKQEIIRLWGQTPFPTSTLKEAYHASLKLNHERERKKDIEQTKAHQIRKVQDDETHELRLVKQSQGQGGAAAISETYTATIPKSLVSNPAKYSTLTHSLATDPTSSVQQCGDAWYCINLTEGGIDSGPLVQPLSSVDHAERDCEIIDDQTGKLALYETLKKSLRELPKLGYSKDHWLRFFQKICRLVDKELFNLYLEETDPTTILTALAQLLDGTSKMEQIEYKIRNFRRLKDHNIASTLHRFEALLHQRIKERSRKTKDKRTAMSPLSLLNTKLWCLSKLVVPALGAKIKQKIDRRELAGETVDIEELIKYAQEQEEKYQIYKPQDQLSLQNQPCQIYVTPLETVDQKRSLPYRNSKDLGEKQRRTQALVAKQSEVEDRRYDPKKRSSHNKSKQSASSRSRPGSRTPSPGPSRRQQLEQGRPNMSRSPSADKSRRSPRYMSPANTISNREIPRREGRSRSTTPKNRDYRNSRNSSNRSRSTTPNYRNDRNSRDTRNSSNRSRSQSQSGGTQRRDEYRDGSNRDRSGTPLSRRDRDQDRPRFSERRSRSRSRTSSGREDSYRSGSSRGTQYSTSNTRERSGSRGSERRPSTPTYQRRSYRIDPQGIEIHRPSPTYSRGRREGASSAARRLAGDFEGLDRNRRSRDSSQDRGRREVRNYSPRNSRAMSPRRGYNEYSRNRSRSADYRYPSRNDRQQIRPRSRENYYRSPSRERYSQNDWYRNYTPAQIKATNNCIKCGSPTCSEIACFYRIKADRVCPICHQGYHFPSICLQNPASKNE